MHSFDNPYRGSVAAELFSKTGKAAFLDIDGTLTYADDDFSGPMALDYIRSNLKAYGIPLIFSSARTPEMMMSESRFIESARLGFKRQLPRRGTLADGSLAYVPSETTKDRPFLDADAILGFGTGPFLLHGEGYMPDAEYERELGYFWRGTILRAIESIEEIDLLLNVSDLGYREEIDIDSIRPVTRFLARIEDERSYARGLSDVQPLPFRIQFNLEAESAEERACTQAYIMFVAIKYVISQQLKRHGLFESVRVVDESRPDDGRYTFYLMPVGSSKEELVTHLVKKLCEETGRPIETCSIFIAGDSLTDLPCCDAAPGAQGRFVLAGTSRLGPYFRPGCNRNFADMDLSGLRKRLTQLDAQGRYRLAMKSGPDRTFVVCDTAYPGLRAPQSVAMEVTEWASSPH